jgi:ferrous iron transport protein A
MTQAMPLTSFPRGTTVKVESFCAGSRSRCRLCALGLTPGTLVTIDSCGSGPCKISVRGSSLVIGQGLAEKVLATMAN